MSAAKAWAGAGAAFLTSLLSEWTGGQDRFEPRDVLVGLVSALGTFAVVYTVQNKSS